MFLLVVRNEKLPHFVRFNAMQSILLDICIMLGGLIIQVLLLLRSHRPFPCASHRTRLAGIT